MMMGMEHRTPPQVCHRTATYAGRDGWGREQHATIPLPDDLQPSKTITRFGTVLTLVMVQKMDTEEKDWFTVAGAVCRPQSL